MRPLRLVPLAVALAQVAPATALGAPTRIKELADFQGVRENELFGYGLVVGLAGTGDSERVFFTSQAIAGVLGRLGIRVDPREVRVRNVAAVMVTARLPTYARPGSRIDVTVASMGNARSLAGGVLLVTPLNGADGRPYALAQGPVQVGGFEAHSYGSLVQKNTATSGRVPQGATVERNVAPELEDGPLVLGLRRPDFTTATRIAQAINERLGAGSARAVDPATVRIEPPPSAGADRMALFATIESIEVEPDRRARVVVSERTGTVVAGAGVRIRAAAVAHGGLQVTVGTAPVVSQPGPFSRGVTSATPVSKVEASETRAAVTALPDTASVQDLAAALNQLGASPRDLVAILQALAAAGALDGDLEVL